jgi:hypothetical protein
VCRAEDPVEAALADALRSATAAGQWGVVSQLAAELEARRWARDTERAGAAASRCDLALGAACERRRPRWRRRRCRSVFTHHMATRPDSTSGWG